MLTDAVGWPYSFELVRAREKQSIQHLSIRVAIEPRDGSSSKGIPSRSRTQHRRLTRGFNEACLMLPNENNKPDKRHKTIVDRRIQHFTR